MRILYRTIDDVFHSPWAAQWAEVNCPADTAANDRILRSTKLEDSIYKDLRSSDSDLDQIEQAAVKRLPSFPSLSRDIFQSFYSLMPRQNEATTLSVAARKFNTPILEHIT